MKWQQRRIFSSSFCVTIAYACMNQLSFFYSISFVLFVILPRSLLLSSFLSLLSLSLWNNVHHISCSQLKLQSIITNIFLSFSFLNFIFLSLFPFPFFFFSFHFHPATFFFIVYGCLVYLSISISRCVSNSLFLRRGLASRHSTAALALNLAGHKTYIIAKIINKYELGKKVSLASFKNVRFHFLVRHFFLDTKQRIIFSQFKTSEKH